MNLGWNFEVDTNSILDMKVQKADSSQLNLVKLIVNEIRKEMK